MWTRHFYVPEKFETIKIKKENVSIFCTVFIPLISIFNIER